MVKLTIDGRTVEVKEGTTVLEAAKQAGINIPTLCYLKEYNEIGACRLCLVEIEGSEKLCASCDTAAEDGMVVKTNSERVRKARKTNLELILSEHNTRCTSCVRSGNCTLQTLANELNINDIPYETEHDAFDWDKSFPLIRDNSRCVKCMRCVSVCEKVQGLGVWEVNGSGAHTAIKVRDGIAMADVNCALCGQCITHCPTGALTARDDTEKLYRAIEDPDTVTVLQVAPAVRSAYGEALGIPAELATEKRMAAAFKALGADYVFDTNFTADLTIMEETNEFIKFVTSGEEHKYPMFTSCCPGWVRFAKLEYPDIVPSLSSAKSPQQMFGAVTKTYFANKMGIAPEKIFCVSIMPCVAKKYECDVDEVNAGELKDVDMVLTTREVCRMIKANHIDAASLPECEFDSPLGEGSGAAVIFGATGGVMEAALRTAHFILEGENPAPDAYAAVRGGKDEIREATVTLAGKEIHAAVTSGLMNTRKLIESIISGEKKYDFVEIMACPGGCAGGGGQPICEGREPASERAQTLYGIDKNNTLRYSHENSEVKKLYSDLLGEPLSHKAHELLHTDQTKWKLKK